MSSKVNIIAHRKSDTAEPKEVLYLKEDGDWGPKEEAAVFNRKEGTLILSVIEKHDNTITASLYPAEE